MAHVRRGKGPADAFAYGKAKDTFKKIDKRVAELVGDFETLSESATIRATNSYDKAKKTREAVGIARMELEGLCISADAMWNRDRSKCFAQSGTSHDARHAEHAAVLAPTYQKKVEAAVRKAVDLAGACQTLGRKAKGIEDELSVQSTWKLWTTRHPLMFAALKALIKVGSHGLFDIGDFV
ncbi:hypothetical protein SPI_05906 [Niveomyces insectorum RCEF 264]|uniref:Uncharacterized protein n=1 Tax=Niveomyces insectorum RCEF 264 TaxID=1081102 RepID=A0A167SKP2_9HYPO|nr:hypothetical protein SPI_05906 [Niveomyces insectorum RCEF 264]